MPLLTFRPLTGSDLPLVAAWLGAPHVVRWWRNPAALEQVRAKYLPRIYGPDATEVFVIVEGPQDIGIIQRYRLNAHPDWQQTLATAGLTSAKAAGIDYLLGEVGHTGRGIGSRAVQQFVDGLFTDWPDVDWRRSHAPGGQPGLLPRAREVRFRAAVEGLARLRRSR
jgi:aminoglycoside 6'-N-acetyltransferase